MEKNKKNIFYIVLNTTTLQTKLNSINGSNFDPIISGLVAPNGPIILNSQGS